MPLKEQGANTVACEFQCGDEPDWAAPGNHDGVRIFAHGHRLARRSPPLARSMVAGLTPADGGSKRMQVTLATLPAPPYRAEHIGSLLRPRELKDAFRARAEERLGEAELRAIQDRLIRDVVRLQESVGLRSITDGEFRRTAWSAGFIWALDGLVPRDSLFDFTDERGDRIAWQTCYAERRMRRTRGIATEEFAFVRALTERTVKVTMPSPSFLHFFRGRQCANPAEYADLE